MAEELKNLEPVTPQEDIDTAADTKEANVTDINAQENVEALAEVETEENVEAPVKTETEENVEAPVETETEENVEAPVETETEENIEVPAKAETEENVEVLAEIEADESVEVPVKAETEENVDVSVEAESEENLEAPVEEETEEKEETSADPKEAILATETVKKRTGDIYDQIQIVKRDDLDTEVARELNPELEMMYEKTLNKFSNNERVNGHVIRITDKEVVVDIGFKSEGLIPLDEFGNNIPELGDEIEIYVDKIEDRKGQLILSKKKADFLRAWDHIKDIFEGDGIIEGYIIKRIKGGMIVDLGSVEGFLPGSQIDVRPVLDFDSYVGKMMELKIVKLNEARKNIVVSRKEILEEALKEKREELLSQIQVDQILKGRVKNITDFGAFIDLGGIDGLLHITDMSWGRIKHPSEILSIDDVVEVKVIDYDTDKQRVSLGLKQLEAHPWEDIEQRYPIDSVIKGRVVSITNYGVFIELEKGVEGLIHISELSWTQHIKHPSEIFQINDEVETKVLAIDSHDRKISLGVKQLQPDPWDELEKKYTPGMKVNGIVRNLTQFGAFVEIEEGIDGLIHVSELSWIKVIRHPKEILQKGQNITVVILEINNETRKISLGYKQLESNPWDDLKIKYKPGKMIKAKVLKVLDKGIIMTIEDEEVEAIVPLTNMPKKDKRDYTRGIKVDDELELRVVEVRQNERKIVLASEDLGLSEDDKDIVRVMAKQGDATQKIEIPEEILLKFQDEKTEPKAGKKSKAETKPVAKEADTEKTEKVEESEKEAKAVPKTKPKTKSKTKPKKDDTKTDEESDSILKKTVKKKSTKKAQADTDETEKADHVEKNDAEESDKK